VQTGPWVGCTRELSSLIGTVVCKTERGFKDVLQYIEFANRAHTIVAVKKGGMGDEYNRTQEQLTDISVTIYSQHTPDTL